MTWLGSACRAWIKAVSAEAMLPVRAWAGSGLLNCLDLPLVLGSGSGPRRRGERDLRLGACPATRKMKGSADISLGVLVMLRLQDVSASLKTESSCLSLVTVSEAASGGLYSTAPISSFDL